MSNLNNNTDNVNNPEDVNNPDDVIDENTQPTPPYLHNILSDRVRDLSGNVRLQFLNFLLSALDNNENSNINVLPMANNFMTQNAAVPAHVSLNSLINRTLLQEKDPYKKVLSEEGNDQLKKVIYNKDDYDTHQCVISLEDFVNGEEVTQLPCKHIFKTESIETWLKEESHKCPVCRYELKFNEIKKEESSDNVHLFQNSSTNNSTSNQSNIRNHTPYSVLFNNMDFMYNPMASLHRPSRSSLATQQSIVNRILYNREQYEEDRLIQNAIMASIYETNNINTGVNSIIHNTEDAIENEILTDSDEENLLQPMTINDTVLEDIDSDDETF